MTTAATYEEVPRTDTEKLMERLNRMVKLLSDRTGIEFTLGYIGNCSGFPDSPMYQDDRYWYVFAPHPGRVGKHHDSIGGVRTEQLQDLLVILRGALDLADVIRTPR